jgi:hypothetical protein
MVRPYKDFTVTGSGQQEHILFDLHCPGHGTYRLTEGVDTPILYSLRCLIIRLFTAGVREKMDFYWLLESLPNFKMLIVHPSH